MSPPPPWPFFLARLATTLLFWPLTVGATGAMAIMLSFFLAGHVLLVGAVASILAALAAGLFFAVRHYRWRTPPLDAQLSAICAALMLGTAMNLPLGVAAFSPAGIDDARVIAALALAAFGQVGTIAAFRWTMCEPRPAWP